MAETKVSFIITGASKGIGREIAIKFAADGGIVDKVAKGSKMVLMSRDLVELEKTRAMVKHGSSNVDVCLISFDLGVESEVIKCTKQALDFIGDPGRFDKNVLVLNADSEIGLSTPAAHLDNFSDLTKYFNVNIVSCIYQAGKFCNFFSYKNCFIVNMSSRAAMVAFKKASLTCTSKAAKQMFFNCIMTDHPDVKVLHYSPGAVESETFIKFRDTTDDEEMKMFFKMLSDDNMIVQPAQTAERLAKVVKDNEYKNGDFVDYYGDSSYFDAMFSQKE